jgi:hypothetical protein
MLIKACRSCGMPMETLEQHGGANPLNPYCTYCTDELGNLKSYDEVLKGMTDYMLITMKLEYKSAQLKAREEMIKHPAWKSYSKSY